VAEKCS